MVKLSSPLELVSAFNLPTYEAGLIQVRAYRSLKNFMTNQLSSSGLTMAEWALVGQLYKHKSGLRLSKIAAVLSVEASLVSNFINSLEAKGYVKRTVDGEDKRAKIVVLTDLGRQRIPVIEKQLRAEMRQFLAQIPPADLIGYLHTLTQLAALA